MVMLANESGFEDGWICFRLHNILEMGANFPCHNATPPNLGLQNGEDWPFFTNSGNGENFSRDNTSEGPQSQVRVTWDVYACNEEHRMGSDITCIKWKTKLSINPESVSDTTSSVVTVLSILHKKAIRAFALLCLSKHERRCHKSCACRPELIRMGTFVRGPFTACLWKLSWPCEAASSNLPQMHRHVFFFRGDLQTGCTLICTGSKTVMPFCTKSNSTSRD